MRVVRAVQHAPKSLSRSSLSTTWFFSTRLIKSPKDRARFALELIGRKGSLGVRASTPANLENEWSPPLQVSVLREPREAIYAPRSAALSPQFACSTRDAFRVEWIRKCDDIVMERVVSSARLRLDESP